MPTKRAMVDFFLSNYEDAMRYKFSVSGEKHAQWDRLMRWYMGVAIEDTRTPKLPDVRPNFIRSVCELVLASYIGDDPEAFIWPQEADDDEIAVQLQALYKSDWDAGSAQDELTGATQNGIIEGTGILYRYYDNVLGRIVRRAIDPRHFFVHPHADRMLLSTDMVFHVALKPLSKLIRLYPGVFASGDDSLDTAKLAMENDYAFRLGESLPMYAQPRTNPTLPLRGGKIEWDSDVFEQSVRVRASAAVCQVWLRDIGLVDWLLDSETRDRVEKEWSQPSGLITIVGNKIAAIEENPWAREAKRGRLPFQTGTFPYTPIRSAYRPNHWYGKGEVEDLIQPQRAVNVIASRTTEHIWKTVRPPYLYDKTKGSFPSKMVWGGEKTYGIRGDVNNALAPVPVADLHPMVFRYMEQLWDWMIRISGTNEASFGMRQPGVPSGVGIRQLQSQFYARNAPRRKALERSLAHDCNGAIEMMLEAYPEERVERLLGKGAAAGWDQRRKQVVSGFDVKVAVGQSLRLDPITVRDITMELAKLNVFRTPANAMEIDERIKILKKFRRHLPDVENDIRDLEKTKRTLIEEEVERRRAGASAVPVVQPQVQPVEAQVPLEVA